MEAETFIGWRKSTVTDITYDALNEQHVSMLDRVTAWTWALLYPSGLQLSEAETALDIWEQRRGAHALAVIRPDGAPVVAIDLQPDYMPVFYRKYEQGLNLRLDTRWQECHDMGSLRRLSGTIYGRARWTADGLIDTTLWAAVGGEFGPCPAHMIDVDEVKQCLAGRVPEEVCAM